MERSDDGETDEDVESGEDCEGKCEDEKSIGLLDDEVAEEEEVVRPKDCLRVRFCCREPFKGAVDSATCAERYLGSPERFLFCRSAIPDEVGLGRLRLDDSRASWISEFDDGGM